MGYLLLRCPVCGSITNVHIEYNYGFPRNIYNCLNCNWTNRYTQITITDTTTTPVNNYPSGIYTFQTNTTILNGGYKNERG